jgi:hypothetical protein
MSNVLGLQFDGSAAMLWLYAWAAAPYVRRVAIECFSDIWNGRASVVDCAERLVGLAL